MERLWLVTLDTSRLRRALRSARARAVARAIMPAAAAAGLRVLAACVVPCGLRALVASPAPAPLRAFVRRFIALSASFAGSGVSWRSSARIAPVASERADFHRHQLRRWHAAHLEDNRLVTQRRRSGTSAARRGAVLLRMIDRAIDSSLGADEAAARVRRYVADHDAPPDDSAAFGRLCAVIFAQGLSFEAFERRRDAFVEAFAGFDPRKIARFDSARFQSILAMPIIRNETKIRACMENAKRWTAARDGAGSYLARVAQAAGTDDAAPGWPALAAMLQADFTRLGEIAARQTLKRWGFFTAFAHPGARRALERLGLVKHGVDAAAVQRIIGGVAQAVGRDPYAVEASLALFAGVGPCRPKAQCDQCPLCDRCPTGSAN